MTTYNVHGSAGWDRGLRPRLILDVLAEIDADVVALQEVAASAQCDMPRLLREHSGYHILYLPTVRTSEGSFGNALLTRDAVQQLRQVDLSVGKREPRAAIDVELNIEIFRVQIVATHLGLRGGERNLQVRRLLNCLQRNDVDLGLLMGDFNDWPPCSRLRRRLRDRFDGVMQPPPTYPAIFPLLALDQIWSRPFSALACIRAHASPLSRRASDHLPLVAEITLPDFPSWRQPCRHAGDIIPETKSL